MPGLIYSGAEQQQVDSEGEKNRIRHLLFGTNQIKVGCIFRNTLQRPESRTSNLLALTTVPLCCSQQILITTEMFLLAGLRDWYLRNTVGSSHQNQPNGKVNAGVSTKANGQPTVGGAIPARRRTLGAMQQSSFQTDGSHHQAPPHQAPPLRKPTLPHSATFHGHPLHSGRWVLAHQHSTPPTSATH